jgi:acyl-CoA dehydrogenase
MSPRAEEIGARVAAFVREVVVPYEHDPRRTAHGPSDELVAELRERARTAGVLTPHILPDGAHLTQRETAYVLRQSGLSPLGPLAVNTAAPDEGNMYLLGKVGTPEQKRRFLDPLVQGRARSAFFMTEPAEEGGAGSDPSMMKTIAALDGNHWVVNGRKAFITGADGAQVGIVMAKSADGACMFLVDLPDPAIVVERVLDTIDSSMPGGTPSCESKICASQPIRCWGIAAKASNMRRSASLRRGCRIACAGSGRACARTRSRPIMPAAVMPSAKC